MEGIKHVKHLLKDWLDEDVREDDTFYEEEEKNKQYFYANTCHVCNSLDQGKRLKRCGSCYLISYCGNSHQAQHWPAHKKLCKVVKEIISRTGGPSIFGKTKGMNQKVWTKRKVNAKLIVSLKLGRDLYPSEKYMFQFPRACCVCHESDPNALINCICCGNSSFCKDHASDPNHKYLCSSFFFCFSFDRLRKFTFRMLISEIAFVLLNSEAMDFIPPSDQIIKSPLSMRKFLDIYFKKVIDIRRKKSRPEYWDMFISEYFSRPLTLFSVMEKINFVPTSDLIVHVLGANYLELSDISAWEIILHWIPKIQRLKIVLIGPELPTERLKPEICAHCNGKKKSISVETYEAYYHNYMEKGYTKPNLVIGYNVGIAEFENPGAPEDTWKPTILSLPKNESPLILTFYTEEEARKDHKRLCLILGNKTNFACFEKNQFASLKPLRDFETEGIFFQNNYTIVYNNLQNMKNEKVEEVRPVLKLIRKVNSEEQKDDLNKKGNKGNPTTLEKKKVPKSNSSSGENKKVSFPIEKKKTTVSSVENKKNVTLSATENNKFLTPTSKEKPKPSNTTSVGNKKVLTATSTESKKTSNLASTENKKISTPVSTGKNKFLPSVSAEQKKVSSTPGINEPTLEELKEENKHLMGKIKRLQVAIEEENRGIKIAPERKNLIREVTNIEESMKREIHELREKIMNLNVDH